MIPALSSFGSILGDTSRNSTFHLSPSPVRLACRVNHHRPHFLLPFWILTLALHPLVPSPSVTYPHLCPSAHLLALVAYSVLTYTPCALCDAWKPLCHLLLLVLSGDTNFPSDLNLNILVPFMPKFFFFCPTNSSSFAQPSTLRQGFFSYIKEQIV